MQTWEITATSQQERLYLRSVAAGSTTSSVELLCINMDYFS